eukprot:jgi/Tetstr1/442918/TSEL_030981.t1
MRKPIEMNIHVAARRGPFEPAALGRVRQHMALKFGNVVESVASNKFRIRWDDGTESCETTNFSKAVPGAGPDTWQMFTQMVEDFNRNRMMMPGDGVWITFDEAMSAYQPASTKTGGLPNISFIKPNPKLLGTEGKTA